MIFFVKLTQSPLSAYKLNDSLLKMKVTMASFLVESPRFKAQSAMIVAFKECNETYSNVYFDLLTRKWHVYKYPTCLSTQKDVLSFCQRIYPKLNVVNVYQLETVTRFNLYSCPAATTTGSDTRACLTTPPVIKLTKPYKCLHGDFKEAKLSIPLNCQIQHLFGQNECKSDAHWRLLSNEKCKASGFNLNSSNLLQWCDASTGGISSFAGIEFVCCPPSHSYFPTTRRTTVLTTRKSTTDLNFPTEEDEDEEEDIDDENDEYHDDAGGSDGLNGDEKNINTLLNPKASSEEKPTSTQSNKVNFFK
jgi:hypothetical protein